MKSLNLTFAILSITLAIAGCQSSPSAEPFGTFHSATQPLVCSSLKPLAPATRTYRITAGDGVNQKAVVCIEPPTSDIKPYLRHTPDQRIEHLRKDEAGNLILIAVEDLDNQVITYYNPPMVVLPAQMAPGKTVTFYSDLTVVNRDYPDQQRDTGECITTITYEGKQDVQTAEGLIQCDRISSKSDIRLKLAKVSGRTTEWYAPQRGLIAQSYEETVIALILSWTHRRTMVISQPTSSK